MAKKILIVDDEPDILRAAKVRLISFGYDVITTCDGKEIVELVGKNMPDLILLDLRLPQMSGDEICAKLKSDEKLKHIPVIIFTASSDTSTNIKVKESGADGYLIKPFAPEDLLQIIKKFIG
jgi:DNA-binding response OmpR family regulator